MEQHSAELGIICWQMSGLWFQVPKGDLMLSQVTSSTMEWASVCNVDRGPSRSLSIIFGNSKKPVSHQSSLPKMGVEFNFLEIIKNIAHILFSKALDIILAMCKE